MLKNLLNLFVSFFFLHVALSFLIITYWRDCLFSTVFFFNSFVINWLYMHGLISGLYSVPLTCVLILCEYHSTMVTIVLQYSLKSESRIPPALFLFLNITWLFRVFCSSIQNLGSFFSVLWKMLLVFLKGIACVCGLLWVGWTFCQY